MTNSHWADVIAHGPRIPYLDNCPRCRNGKLNTPIAPVYQYGPDPDGVRADYACWSCGHQWFTGWARDDTAHEAQIHEINHATYHHTPGIQPDTCLHCTDEETP